MPADPDPIPSTGSEASAAAAPDSTGTGATVATAVPPPDAIPPRPPTTDPDPTLHGVPAVTPRPIPRLTAVVLVGSLLAAAGAAAGAVALASRQSDGAGWPGTTAPTAVTRPD
ncbi:hypothetical protein ABT341_31235, partial [Pseudonocardia alni]